MNNIIETFESLPVWAKVLLLIFFGYIISPVYRILKYLETKNTVTLVVGILGLVTGIGNLFLEIVDIVTEATKGRITVLAD